MQSGAAAEEGITDVLGEEIWTSMTTFIYSLYLIKQILQIIYNANFEISMLHNRLAAGGVLNAARARSPC